MAALIWDASSQLFKDADVPKIRSSISVPSGVTWASSSDADIKQLMDALYATGQTLADYGWQVGQERTVHLAGDVNEDVVFVIEDLDGVTSGGTSYKAAVGQKNGLLTNQPMNSSNTNSGGYNSSTMKTYVEGTYQTALQNATTGNFWSSVKEATHQSQIYSSGLQSTTAKVILHSIFEFCGSFEYNGNETTANGFHQFVYYTTTANRIKTRGEGGMAVDVWTRSASTRGSDGFCIVYTNGGPTQTKASYYRLVAPFCVL